MQKLMYKKGALKVWTKKEGRDECLLLIYIIRQIGVCLGRQIDVCGCDYMGFRKIKRF